MDHHIHIEQLDDDHDHPPYTSYTSSKDSLEYDHESDQDRLNRFSNTSTLVGAAPPAHTYPLYLTDIKTTPAARRRNMNNAKNINNNTTTNHRRSAWYRFFHSEAGRLASSFIFFFVICIGMAFCNQLSDHRWVETGYTNVLLRDRGFDVIAAQADIQPANTFVMTSVVFTVLGIGMICPNWTMRAIVLRRILWVIGTLSAYRAMTLSVTTLPTPKEECRPSLKTGFWEMFMVALQMIPGTVEACTDDIFSGHTVFMVSCAIQWRLYCKNKWITYFSYLYISIGLYFVVATRLHYTVDVILAVFITFAVWSIYIAMIDVVMEQEYFGIASHHEKYTVFDSATSEYRFAQEAETLDDDEETRGRNATMAKNLAINSRRLQLEHHMNRLRGPRIGYGRGEYDRVAFLPVQFNLWLKGVIRWCDGLDLRMNPPVVESSSASCSSSSSTLDESFSATVASRWEELVVRHRAEHASGNGSQTPRIRRKMDEGHEDEEEIEYDEMGRRREMVQVYHPWDGSAAAALEDIRIDNYTHELGQQQHGRWRSVPSRTASPRLRSPTVKEDKSDKMDRSRKLHILKIVLIIFVNAILLIKVIQAVQNRSGPSSHWPKDMEAYPGGAIFNNNSTGPILTVPEYGEQHFEHDTFLAGEKNNNGNKDEESGGHHRGEEHDTPYENEDSGEDEEEHVEGGHHDREHHHRHHRHREEGEGHHRGNSASE